MDCLIKMGQRGSYIMKTKLLRVAYVVLTVGALTAASVAPVFWA